MLHSLVALVIGYICGSIPSGVIVTRIAGAEDPRSIGSKNIGATNVLRTGRKDLAAITLLADAFKGMIPVLVATYLDDGTSPVHLGVATAFGAFFGHLFPVFLGFRGGKGVATFIGCLIGLAWPAAFVFAIVWLVVAVFTRYSSVAALTASSATPVLLAWLGRWEAAALFVVLAVAIWAKHSANIRRLIGGTESKIGGKASSAPVS